MGAVNLRHPDHGEMVESNNSMVQIAKANGWEEFDPPVRTVSAIPSFLLAVGDSNLPVDFPGREPLIEGGLTTWASIVGKTSEELQKLKGIGAATARNILVVMNS